MCFLTKAIWFIFCTQAMAGNRIMVCAFVAALLACGMASPRKPPTARDPKEGGTLQQLLERDTKDSAGQQEQAGQTHAARTERLTHLSEDERELRTKQILHAISGMWCRCKSCYIIAGSLWKGVIEHGGDQRGTQTAFSIKSCMQIGLCG